MPDAERTNVGLVVFWGSDASGNSIPVGACSGVLVSSRVLLTAAHACVSLSVTVCFDNGPISWSLEGDQIQLQGVTSTFNGTAYPNPEFALQEGGNGLPNFLTHDVAVVILDEPVPQTVVGSYAQLPTAGLTETLSSKTFVELVGYGMQEHLSPRNTGVANTWVGLLMRCSAQAKIIPGNFAWSDEFIRCSANPGQGKGGISYGDSGGAVFLEQSNVVLALNSYATNPNCVGQTYHIRLDTVDILSWINQEVNLYG
ncbi:MAG: S1 family peptidase [Candidatus Bathyarchaeota archaeon]|nr:S1 family peptidase [Candidatus Bathyarchaeota archaeon]